MIESDTVGALVDEFINCGLNLIVETKDRITYLLRIG